MPAPDRKNKADMYLCVKGIYFVSSYDFSSGFWNFSPPYFIEVRVTLSLVLFVMFCR